MNYTFPSDPVTVHCADTTETFRCPMQVTCSEEGRRFDNFGSIKSRLQCLPHENCANRYTVVFDGSDTGSVGCHTIERHWHDANTVEVADTEAAVVDAAVASLTTHC